MLHLVRPAAGGLRDHVLNLCSRLARDDYDVMAAGALGPELRRALTNAEVRWANVGFPEDLRLKSNTAAADTFARLFSSQKPDVVHAHGYHAAFLAALAVRRATPRPRLVFTAHTLPFTGAGRTIARLAHWLACRRTVAAADRVITVSDAVRAALQRAVGAAGSKCVTVHNGINPDVYRASTDYDVQKEELGLHPSAVVVGVIARLSPEKGVDVFIRAAELISEKVPNVEFLIVGDGPDRQRLEALAHAHHVLGNTVFAGARRDIPAVLSVVDVLAIPSRSEAFSLAALEGLAAGVPVVASDVGGIPEVLDGAPHAWLVPPEDPLALGQKVMDVLSELPEDEEEGGAKPSEMMVGPDGKPVRFLVSERAYDLSEEDDWIRERPEAPAEEIPPGLAYVQERFSLDRMVERTEAVYEQVLGDG